MKTILFGPYVWLVLEEREDKILVVTKDIIDAQDFHDTKGPVTWETSAIRHYLNNDFYDSLSDKHLIVEVLNINPNNTWYKTSGGNDTLDKVFLLSMDELVRYYFGDSSDLLDNPLMNQRYWFNRIDKNNINRRSQYLNEPWWYWTRTMGKSNKFAVYIHYDGNVGIQGNGVGKRDVIGIHPITKSNCGGIRPALWLMK